MVAGLGNIGDYTPSEGGPSSVYLRLISFDMNAFEAHLHFVIRPSRTILTPRSPRALYLTSLASKLHVKLVAHRSFQGQSEFIEITGTDVPELNNTKPPCPTR